MLQGFRKGLVRTAVSMVFFIIITIMSSWLNPHVGDFIREKTDWQEKVKTQCSEILFQGLESQVELPEGLQSDFIEELPLPQTMKDKLIENNNSDSYRQLAAESFAEYVSGYIAHGIINGIAFLVSFIASVIVVRMILYAVDILTELPVIGMVNRLAGMALGGIQGILWIWVAFLLLSLLYETSVGAYLIGVIQTDPVLSKMYDMNYLIRVIMNILN